MVLGSSPLVGTFRGRETLDTAESIHAGGVLSGYRTYRHHPVVRGLSVACRLQATPSSDAGRAGAGLHLLLGAQRRSLPGLRPWLPFRKTRRGPDDRTYEPVHAVSSGPHRRRPRTSLRLRDAAGRSTTESARGSGGCAAPRETEPASA